MLTTTILATLVALVSATPRDRRDFAVLQHYGDGPLMNCRIDPIVQPGGPSAHLHTFMGGNNIGFSTTGADLQNSQCTTALPRSDKSAYWFPSLYFKDPVDGKLEPVPFFYMNVYYFFDATNDNIKAFPTGLQIVSGNATLRAAPKRTGDQNLDPSQGPVNAAQITCPRSNFNPPSWPSGSDGSMAGIGDPRNQGSGLGFPFQNCDGYASPMRVDVHFPSCYNPAAGLTNFRNNMAFPSHASNGRLDCPQGWIHVPHMFYETYWDTHRFRDRWTNTRGQSQPFVFSNGDATGFSAHGDFLAAWNERDLQQIIDSRCNVGHAGIHTCPGYTGGVNDQSTSCKATCPVNEATGPRLDNLPGSNPLAGWKYGAGSPAPAPQNPAPVPNPPRPSPNPPKPSPNPPRPSPNPPAQSPAPQQPSPPPQAEPPKSVPTTLVPVPTPKADPASSSSTTTTQPAPKPTRRPGGKKKKVVWNTVTVWKTTTVTGDGPTPTAPNPGAVNTNAPGAKDVGGFRYVGCFKDAEDRVLAGKIRPNLGRVSNSNCVAYCSEKGWAVAGTEYGGQCYCGNSLSKVEELPEEKCSMACEGQADQTCGGGWALSVFSKDGTLPSAGPAQASKRHVHNHLLHHRRVGHFHHAS